MSKGACRKDIEKSNGYKTHQMDTKHTASNISSGTALHSTQIQI